MASFHHAQNFNISDFKTKMYKLGELESFLVDELPKEDKLTKMFHIRERFKAVLDKIDKHTDEFKRREDMYHLINVVTQWKDIKMRHKFYTPERISNEYHLKLTLNKMLEAFEQSNPSNPSDPSNPSNPSQPNEEKPTEDVPVVVPVPVVEDAVVDDFPDNLKECRWSGRYLGPPKVHGLTEKIKFMERLMVKKTKEDGMFGAIAIVGIPGVGKTTLCQELLKNGKVKKHYDFQVWVCLSKQPEEVVVGGSRKVEILKRMLICLGHDDDVVDAIIENNSDEGNIHKLIYAIRRQLQGRKYVVVLDDASETDLDFLQNLADPTPVSPEGGYVYETMADVFPRDPGGMVIVTARLERDATKIVGEKNVHQLPLLESKGDCWEIFKDTVDRDGKGYPEEHLDLEELITAKCASIPLAAKMMGLIMYIQLKERARRKEERKALEGKPQQAPIS